MQFQRYSKDDYLQLPDKPGIYKYLNADLAIIYVGKAKRLKKRVASYFTKTKLDSRKTHRLVQEIRFIEFVIVESEFDALLLENNLIKEHQPRYNILLKDDKSFPSICITSERFPQIYATRRIEPEKGEYFGPYTSVKAMNGVLDLIRKLYKIRTCRYALTPANVEKKKYKICLEYHIGNCLGPCEGLQTEESYNQEIAEAKKILKGKLGIVTKSYQEKMQQAANELHFEMAHDYKKKLDLLEKFQSKTLIVNRKISATDVFTLVEEPRNQTLFINYMCIEYGAIVNSETIQLKKRIEENNSELLRFAMFDLRKKYQSNNPYILSNINVEPWEGIDISIPKIGDKRKLIDLSLKNALYYKKELLNRVNTTTHNEVLTRLQQDLQLREVPVHIECFDNSNMQGSNPVASMVCFKNGKPSKKDYRKFNIKTVVGPDDFSSMNEVVHRRYKHLMKENLPLPNLIIIDGGKGQLSASVDALKTLGIYGQIPIIGIAKRLEEIYFPKDQFPLHISKKSTSLKLIQRIRDEAHRFAITFHRQKRSNTSYTSELDEIKGIGKKTRELLMKQYGSYVRISEASEKDLIHLIGKSKTQAILNHKKKDQIDPSSTS